MRYTNKLIAAIFFLLPCTGLAQENSPYKKATKHAFEYYEQKEYLRSAKEYSRAFAMPNNTGDATDRYNAACSWVLAGNKDSAYHHLYIAARELGYDEYIHLNIDTDLEAIRSDKRWSALNDLVKANKAKKEKGTNKELIAILDSVLILDQKDRRRSDILVEKYGRNSKEAVELWQRVNLLDSLNVITVTQIIDKYGWLGPEQIGFPGNQALFLVIQHADIKTQMKYLPVMKEAVQKGNARPSSLALLEDRTSLRNGGKQIYGSQIGQDADGTHYVLPLEDPENVDKRRESVGLGPLNEYTQHWGFNWDIEAYKKRISESKNK
ncbi:MAG: hypothetical protein H6551_10550 [Chitinophagales bacterium]|nr:hypothetical protein [Chitinophagaceae bacterium]MCB9065568.1 hypothetical protein [Chitinophagales bacterium]